MFVEKACGVDVVEDVLVPLFQALLKAENEYGWTVRSFGEKKDGLHLDGLWFSAVSADRNSVD